SPPLPGGRRAALALASAVDADPAVPMTAAAGLEAHQPGHRHPGPSLVRHRHHRGVAAEASSGPWAAADSARLRPRRGSMPRSPPPASYLRPCPDTPRGDLRRIAL